MKITRIDIKHFRAFPGPGTCRIDLPQGKNLLVYGENGSGKSSLFHALNEFFNTDPGAPAFDDLANLFGTNERGEEITDGFVRVYLDNDPARPLVWAQGGARPVGDPRLQDAALRKGCLEYRSLLSMNLDEGNLDERLFALAVRVLLAQVRVPLGGMPRTISAFWSRVEQPPTHRKQSLAICDEAIQEFNDAFKAALTDVEGKATELLDHFLGHHLKLRFEYAGLYYDRKTREIKGQELRLSVEFNGKLLPHREKVLNEARLSALALVLYFASVLQSNPDPKPGSPAPLKLLVLDDVLLGLDLANRIPILEILKKHFDDFQMFLFTYDGVWFDMARMLLDPTRWDSYQLYSERVGDPGYDIPSVKGGRDTLQRARDHLKAEDYRAAALYARIAFETRLKNYCTDQGLRVRYNKDPRRVSSEDLWKAVIGTPGGGKARVTSETKSTIETVRKVVLNPLSHAGVSTITRPEVLAAIKTVQELTFTQ